MGPNGSGKSSFIEAIVWCCYGVGVKGAKTAAVLSWSETQAEVLTEWKINGDLYSIYRAGPPNRIEINGEPGTQEQVDSLLGLTKERFLNSVIFGQGVDLFPDRPIPERGQLLDEVLNLSIWEKATKAASAKSSGLQKQLNSKKEELAFVQGKLAQMQTDEFITNQAQLWESTHKEEITRHQQQANEWDQVRESRIVEILDQIRQWKAEKSIEIGATLDDLQSIESEMEGVKANLEQLVPIDTSTLTLDMSAESRLLYTATIKKAELSTKLNLTSETKVFWENNDVCPMCSQSITQAKKEKHLKEVHLVESNLNVDVAFLTIEIEHLNSSLGVKSQTLKLLETQSFQQQQLKRDYERDIKRLEKDFSLAEIKLNALQESKSPYDTQLVRVADELNPYHKQLALLKSAVNPFAALLIQNRQDKESLQKNQEKLNQETKQIQSSMIAADYWYHGFKRIKLYFVQQVLISLQIEIQSAISALGLDGWTVNLATETITKSETVKLGVQINIKSPIAQGEWTVWSGGEAQRLRLAIAMGLASLIQRASGSFFNFEVWDEPTQHLSNQGVEDLLEALRYRADSLGKVIWIVEHSALTYSGFSEIWQAVKEKSGSSITRIS